MTRGCVGSGARLDWILDASDAVPRDDDDDDDGMMEALITMRDVAKAKFDEVRASTRARARERGTNSEIGD